jgi:DNA polymerase type B, organellar and viral
MAFFGAFDDFIHQQPVEEQVVRLNHEFSADFQVETLHYSIQLQAPIGQAGFHDVLGDALDYLLQDVQSFVTHDTDRVGFSFQVLDQMGVEQNFYGGYYRASTLYDEEQEVSGSERLLHSIERWTTSHANLSGSFQAHVYIAHQPNVQALFPLGTNTRYKGGAQWVHFIKSKRCVVPIQIDERDISPPHSCILQLFLLHVSHQFESIHNQSNSESQSELVQLCARLYISKRTYATLTAQPRKYASRKQLVERFVQAYPAFPVQPFSEEMLRQMENHFKVQFVLFEIQSPHRPIYPLLLPVQNNYVQIYGLIQDKHVHFVSSPWQLFGWKELKQFCRRCLVPYAKKCTLTDCQKGTLPYCKICHVCNDLCSSCYTPCEDRTYPTHSRCRHCGVVFYSPVCEQRHLEMQLCPQLFRVKCTLCQRGLHPGYSCEETKCFHCHRIYLRKSDHECFLKSEGLKPPSEQIVVYDYECTYNEKGVHEPYLITLCLPYPEEFKMEQPVAYATLSRYNQFSIAPHTYAFWDEQVPEFFDWIENSVRKTLFYAHNARSYDHIFIKQEFMKRKIMTEDVCRGLKYLQIEIPHIKVAFRDSISFLPSALRYLPKDFHLECSKGFFPHEVMSRQYFDTARQSNFKVPLPDRKFYHIDYGVSEQAVRAQQEDEEWVNALFQTLQPEPSLVERLHQLPQHLQDYVRSYERSYSYNLKQSALEYGVQDVVVLSKVLKIFREETMQMAISIAQVEFDPLQYVTLPSAMMNFYLSSLLPENTIQSIYRPSFLFKQQQDLFLFYVEKNTRYVHPRLKNCFKEGCLRCFLPDQKNFRQHRSFGDLHIETNERLERDQVDFSLYACEWEELKLTERVRSFLEESRFEWDQKIGLDPRDAYKGGKVECYKYFVDSQIQMADFVSQYPTVLLGTSIQPISKNRRQWALPVGTPMVKRNPENYVLKETVLGIAKILVVPPTQLYVPFLSYRVHRKGTYEVLFGLCRTCMEKRVETYCHHSESQRAFVGTYTLAEIRYAEQLGYTIQKWIEVWEYPEGSDSLFQNLILPCMIQKIKSKRKGLLTDENEWTELGKETKVYVEELLGREVFPDEFEDVPSRRTVSKLMMNAFTGKWGQKEEHTTTKTFFTSQAIQCQKLLFNPSMEIKNVRILNENQVTLTYTMKQDAQQAYLRKNDLIVAHITAYGRIMLHEMEHALGDKLIYVDTDSLTHKFITPLPYQIGFRAGDLELEMEEGRKWVCFARKSYAYYHQNKLVCKQKGITLKQANIDLFTPENLYSMITDDSKIIETKKTLLQSTSHYDPQKITIEQVKQVKFHPEYLKRWMLVGENEIDSLPFGYQR